MSNPILETKSPRIPAAAQPAVNDTTAMEAVTGATGYIGSLLVKRLAGEGRVVRALARDPSRLDLPAGAHAVEADLLRPRGLAAALEGCRVAYYLVHSMEYATADGGDFASRDRRAAEAFVAAANAAGVERVVYLGGLTPRAGPPSRHLASRLEVERMLLDGLPRSTALRASIVVGAGSSSFRIIVRLVERLRVLPLARFGARRTRPIDERDVLDYLALTPRTIAAAGRTLDVAGPQELTFAEIIARVAELMGVGRPTLRLPSGAMQGGAAVVARLSGQPLELVRPLMESLEHDLLPRNDDALRLYGLRPRSFDRAVDHALADWERAERLGAR